MAYQNPFEFSCLAYTNTTELDDRIIFDAEPKEKIRRCPYCGYSQIMKHGQYIRTYIDTPYLDKATILRVHSSRYKCNNTDCAHNTFVPQFPEIGEEGSQITHRLRAQILNTDFRDQTIDAVAKRYQISFSTARNLLLEKIELLEREEKYKPITVLGIDEAHLANEMRGVFTDLSDVSQGKLLDIFHNNKKQTIVRGLERFEDPESIKFVMMDMCAAYRAACELVLPYAKVVVDHFHVSLYLTKSVENARKLAVQACDAQIAQLPYEEKAISKKILDIASTGHFLFKIRDLGTERKRRLTEVCKAFPIFSLILRLRDEFDAIYTMTSRAEAEAAYDKWCKELSRAKGTPLEPFLDLKKTVDNWREWIFNYFEVPQGLTNTNAATEAINGEIKRVNRAGCGYTFEVLRGKLLYGNEKIDPKQLLKKSATTSGPNSTALQMLTMGKQSDELKQTFTNIVHSAACRFPELGEKFEEIMEASDPDFKFSLLLESFLFGEYANAVKQAAAEMDLEEDEDPRFEKPKYHRAIPLDELKRTVDYIEASIKLGMDSIDIVPYAY